MEDVSVTLADPKTGHEYDTSDRRAAPKCVLVYAAEDDERALDTVADLLLALLDRYDQRYPERR